MTATPIPPTPPPPPPTPPPPSLPPGVYRFTNTPRLGAAEWAKETCRKALDALALLRDIEVSRNWVEPWILGDVPDAWICALAEIGESLHVLGNVKTGTARALFAAEEALEASEAALETVRGAILGGPSPETQEGGEA